MNRSARYYTRRADEASVRAAPASAKRHRWNYRIDGMRSYDKCGLFVVFEERGIDLTAGFTACTRHGSAGVVSGSVGVFSAFGHLRRSRVPKRRRNRRRYQTTDGTCYLKCRGSGGYSRVCEVLETNEGFGACKSDKPAQEKLKGRIPGTCRDRPGARVHTNESGPDIKQTRTHQIANNIPSTHAKRAGMQAIARIRGASSKQTIVSPGPRLPVANSIAPATNGPRQR
jgi:hypothetical protein